MMLYRDIVNLENNWRNNIIQIGKLIDFEKRKNQAVKFIEELYAFNEMEVLFKPTKVKDHQFRFDKEAALSYFIGGNEKYKEDKGFALNAWEDIEFENKSWIIKQDYALVMGNYYFKKNTKKVKVEFTFGLCKVNQNQIKINLHHSSLPFKNC